MSGVMSSPPPRLCDARVRSGDATDARGFGLTGRRFGVNGGDAGHLDWALNHFNEIAIVVELCVGGEEM